MPALPLDPRPFTAAMLLLLLGLVLRGAIPRGRVRRVRVKALVRAIAPRRLLRSRSGRLDIAAFLFNTVPAGLILGGLIASAGWWAAIAQPAVAHLPAMPVRLPPLLASLILTVLMYLAAEAAYWANHWLSHRVPWLWAFHKVHHTAESLSPLTNYRVHPVDTILFYNMTAAAAGLTGVVARRLLGPGAAELSVGHANLLLFLTSMSLSHLQHTHLWLAARGRWGRWILSPAHHQLHHSTDPAHFNRNLGSTLALFDRLGGTLLIPAGKRPALRFGVDGAAPDPHGFHGAMIHPFVEAVSGLVPRRRPAPIAGAAEVAA